jgi:hypothetical protein
VVARWKAYVPPGALASLADPQECPRANKARAGKFMILKDRGTA